MGNAPRPGCDQTQAGPRPSARHQEWDTTYARTGEHRETAGEHCDVSEASGTRARGDLGENAGPPSKARMGIVAPGRGNRRGRARAEGKSRFR